MYNSIDYGGGYYGCTASSTVILSHLNETQLQVESITLETRDSFSDTQTQSDKVTLNIILSFNDNQAQSDNIVLNNIFSFSDTETQEDNLYLTHILDFNDNQIQSDSEELGHILDFSDIQLQTDRMVFTSTRGRLPIGYLSSANKLNGEDSGNGFNLRTSSSQLNLDDSYVKVGIKEESTKIE